MRSNAKQRNTEKMKKNIWKKLESFYRGSIKSARSLLKQMKVYHFYEDKDGWDDSPQQISGYVNKEMTPEEIFIWMYENDVNPRNMKTPYIYTDEEIGFFRKNRNMAKIEDWKKSIEFYKEQIRKYENRISDAMKNSIENDGADDED